MNPQVPCGTAVFKTAAIPLGEPSGDGPLTQGRRWHRSADLNVGKISGEFNTHLVSSIFLDCSKLPADPASVFRAVRRYSYTPLANPAPSN